MTNLKRMLAARNMTQKQLAQATGLTEAAISGYIRGERRPRLDTAKIIAEALNVNISDLWNVPRDKLINYDLYISSTMNPRELSLIMAWTNQIGFNTCEWLCPIVNKCGCAFRDNIIQCQRALYNWFSEEAEE